jgi:hypothetical protein
MKNKMHYMGFLANFDDSSYLISNLKLEWGFEIRYDSLQRIAKLIAKLDNTKSDIAVIKLIEMGVNSYLKTPDSDSYIHYFYNSFTDEIEFIKHKNEYLQHLIRLMRLFKKGDISLPLEYQFFCRNGTPTLSRMGKSKTSGLSRKRFLLVDKDIPALQDLIQNEEYYNIIKKNENINKAISFFFDAREDKRCFNLYKVYEIIRKDYGGEPNMINNLKTSRKKLSKFRNTMNYLCGMHSRHGVNLQGEGMDINEAEDLIRNLINKWINLKMGI